MRRLIAILLLAASLLAGCGGGGGGDPADLVARLPADTPFGEVGAYVDIAAARDQLGLPDDTDISAYASEGEVNDEAQLRLANAAGFVLAYVALPFGVPVASALDGGSIEAAASAILRGSGQIDVLRTSQPFDEIADSLGDDGYERQGDLLVSRRSQAGVVYRAIADAGDGIVILAGSEAAARQALAREEVAPSRTALLELPGAIRVVGNTDGGSCLKTIAGWEDLKPPEGEFLLEVEGQPSRKAVTAVKRPKSSPPPLPEPTEFGRPDLDADAVRIPFRYDPAGPPGGPLLAIGAQAPLTSIYDCGVAAEDAGP